VAGSYVVSVDAKPVLYLERGGRGILTLENDPARSVDEPSHVELALRALADAVRAGRIGAVALERIDGAPAIGSELEAVLVDLGFRQGPRRLTLRA
jgi:ATP-dependent Lhr-like helicase